MTDDSYTPLQSPDTQYTGPRKYWGKYRGIVLDYLDPLMLGRLLANVPSVPGSDLNWAMPCSPYAGPLVGFYAVPPPGASVWIEFEGGDPNHPIWVGGFWAEGEMPLEPVVPTNHVMKTEFIYTQWNDTPGEGGFYTTVIEPVAPPDTNELIMNVEGITLTCPPNLINITPETIIHEVPDCVITQTEATMEVVVAENSFTFDAGGVQGEYPNMTLTGPIEITGEVEITGNVTITGAVEITGDVEITGAVEILGDVAITGAVEVLGDVEITGATEVLGDVSVLGATEVLGDLSVLGAEEVVGDLAVLGVIEGVVVPPVI